ncbi:MAG: four helix bundle protein [Chloroflexi bacterium]|nr:four helix bundle protein [Chloroflexota bacterium]
MNYQEWKEQVPIEMKGDPLWKVEMFRLALLMADLSWPDATKLLQDKRTLDLSSQLLRAVGSISANFAEGYSRGTGKDRARFYGYSLGSARESRVWYYQGRHVLTLPVAIHRIKLLTQIIRYLLTTIPEQRGQTLREEPAMYQLSDDTFLNDVADSTDLDQLLQNIPDTD